MDVRLALGVSGNKGNQPATGSLGNLVRRHNPQAVEAEFEPRVDWSETPEAHILIADVPGFTKDDVGVQIDNWGNLTISGHRRLEETTTVGWPWPRTERRHGRTLTFSKVFNVPDNLNFDAISAKFEHETLYVVMPKSDGAGRELPGAEDDRLQTEVEGSSPVGAPIPPAATELEETAKETEPEDADRNQEGSSSEIQVIQVPRVMDDDLKDDKRMHLAGGGEEEDDDQRATGEIEGEEEISRPSALHEKGLPSELNIEDQPKDGDRKPTMEELAEGSDELPAGSEIGIAEEGNLPSDDKSTEKRGPGLNIRSKLPVFSKRKAVLVSSVVVLCVGLYISYRLRQAEH